MTTAKRASLAVFGVLSLFSGSSAADDQPRAPEAHDAMLTPVPAARREIATWEEALGLVKARSTDLRLVLLDVHRADAQWRSALGAALPSLNGTATAANQFITTESRQISGVTPAGPLFTQVQTPFPNAANGSLSMSQPMFAPRAWWAIGTAEEGRVLAGLAVDEAKRQIVLSVAQAIIGVFTAERISELNREGLRNALQRLDLAQRKFDLGAGTGLDLVRARTDVAAARGTLVAGNEALRKAREALGLSLGIAGEVGVARDVRLDGLEASAVRTCKPSPIEERSDLLVARQRVKLAERQLTDARLLFSPTLTAQSAISTTTMDTGVAPPTTWNIQGILSVPIWEGGARYGAMHDARAQIRAAEERHEALRRTATVQLDQAKRGVGVAEERRAVAQDARRLAAEQDDLVRRAFGEGRGTSLELVAAAAAMREAEIALALREFELVQARVLAVLSFATCPY